MQFVPALEKLKVTRFAQLAAGDLFVFAHQGGSCLGLVAGDATQNGEKLLLPLGPPFPAGMIGPTLLPAPAMTVVSFDKDFVLQLPADPKGWQVDDPPPEVSCLLVTQTAGYIRANRERDDGDARRFTPCYVDIGTGLLHTTGRSAFHEYAKPAGAAVFAVAWEILTGEPEPRTILAYPWEAR